MLLLLCLITAYSPSVVIAAPFGSGTFGEGKYGEGERTSDPSNPGGSNNSGSSSNSNSSGSSGGCSMQKPGRTPSLFQIDKNGSTAKLYVTPGGNPYNSFFISYGENGTTEQYAEYFNYTNATGAMIHEIHELKPNVSYTFKVQPMNGCRAGEWSNSLSIGVKNGKYYQYGPTQFGLSLKSTASSVKKISKSVQLSPKQSEEVIPPVASTPPVESDESTPAPAPQKNNGGFFGWLKNLFK